MKDHSEGPFTATGVTRQFIDMPDNGTHFSINFQIIQQGELEITHYLEEVELKTS